MTRDQGLLPMSGALPSVRDAIRVGELVDKTPAAPASKHYISRRAHALWKRLRTWYPNKLPEEAPQDYCKIIDAASREELSLLLVNMRSKHVSWPPTFPEFSLLYEQAKAPVASTIDWGARVDTLREYILRKYWNELTQYQRILPWTAEFTGRIGAHDYGFVGLRIPDDPATKAPGRFVRYTELPA